MARAYAQADSSIEQDDKIEMHRSFYTSEQKDYILAGVTPPGKWYFLSFVP